MVATLEPIAIPFAAAIDEVRDTWIEIRRLPDERLVTAIEVLSPTNKGSSGLTEYLDKRHRLRTQGVNLVEIDLLIAGRRLPMAKPLPPGDFFTIISRASKSELGDVYAWSIQRPLPKIPIPLEDPDPDVFLDLAEVFALAYQRGRYARLINYNRPLDLPLHPQDKEWAEKVARERPELISSANDHLITQGGRADVNCRCEGTADQRCGDVAGRVGEPPLRPDNSGETLGRGTRLVHAPDREEDERLPPRALRGAGVDYAEGDDPSAPGSRRSVRPGCRRGR